MVVPAIDMLRQIFPGLSDDALADLTRAGRQVQYPAAVVLCHEGEIENRFYLIIAGRVDVYKHLEGQRLLINQLPSGAHFGDIALLLDLPRTASIVTAEPTEVFELDRDVFERLLKTAPEIAITLSRMVLRRFLTQEEKHLTEIVRLKKRDSPAAKVFLSYARADVAFATRLGNGVLKQGIDIWLDVYRLEPARSWGRQIGEALDGCQAMLLVLSPASVASDNVEDEWNYYLDQKKPVVVALHAPCKVPYRLSKLHYVNFHEADYDQAVARVVAALNTQV